MGIIALIVAVSAGISLAIQGAANAALAHHVGRLEAAVISFLGGTLVLLVLSACVGELPALHALGSVPWWQLLGGVYGALLVTAIIYGTPLLGAALTFAAFMFGQLFFGMLVDGLGLFDVAVRTLSTGRIVGCVLLAVGIGAVCYGRMQEKAHAPQAPSSKNVSPGNESRTKSADVVLLVIMFLAGGCSAAQAPTNTALALTVGSVNASLTNMFVGLVVTFIAAMVRYRGHFAPLKLSFGWWKYTGGLFGAAYVILVVLATPSLGVGIVMGALMLGQLGGGVVLDAYGLMGCTKQTITRWHKIGIALIATGVVVAAFANAGML